MLVCCASKFFGGDKEREREREKRRQTKAERGKETMERGREGRLYKTLNPALLSHSANLNHAQALLGKDQPCMALPFTKGPLLIHCSGVG